MKEGLRYVWEERMIRSVLFLAMVYFTLGMAYMQVFAPLFAKQVLGLGDSGFGFMMSAAGGGALIGALIFATVAPRRHRGMLMLGMVALMGLLLVVFSLSTYLEFLPAVFLAIAVIGMVQTPLFAMVNTTLLQLAPDDKRGRVMGVLSLDRSMITVGAAVAGLVAAALGPQVAQIAFGATLVGVAAVVAARNPSIRAIQ